MNSYFNSTKACFFITAVICSINFLRAEPAIEISTDSSEEVLLIDYSDKDLEGKHPKDSTLFLREKTSEKSVAEVNQENPACKNLFCEVKETLRIAVENSSLKINELTQRKGAAAPIEELQGKKLKEDLIP